MSQKDPATVFTLTYDRFFSNHNQEIAIFRKCRGPDIIDSMTGTCGQVEI